MSCSKPPTIPSPSMKTTLKDLIIDYKKKNSSLYNDLNGVLALKGKSIPKVFLRRCVCNRNRHQWCLSNKAVDDAVNKLLTHPTFTTSTFKDFEDLYDTIYNIIGHGNTGISYCTVYDTAIRYGWTLSPKIEPDKYVYVHRKLVSSAKHILGGKAPIVNHCRINRSEFDKKEPEFKKLTALEIEDFLCVYHADIINLP